MQKFILTTDMKPAGDQPKAIRRLICGIQDGHDRQTLLGVTGSGKTFTIANVIAQVQKPTLVIAHNKTLAAQLAQEYQEFFPKNAVHYFVSYYDYYQPEAYMPVTDTYIEKDAQINEEIDRLRHASTEALLTRSDVIIVASVSCIYGLGSPKEYKKESFHLSVGMKIARRDILERLVKIFFERTNADLIPGKFRVVGSVVEVMPTSKQMVYRIESTGETIVRILAIDPISSVIQEEMMDIFLFPAKHFLTEGEQKKRALKNIKTELDARVKELEKMGKELDAERLRRRTMQDIAMIREVGYCSGIENYSRHLSGKRAGQPPETLLSYFPHTKNGKPDFLTVIDESHVAIPQLRGMYNGDHARKKTLVEYGFRLPSAIDNRPLRYEEFKKRIGGAIYTSATPGEDERKESRQIVEQVIRPTGLVDPEVGIRPIVERGNYKGQVQDFIDEAIAEIKKGNRVLATTLTKRMAEDLSAYFKERGIKAEYVHSDIKTIDRIHILTKFRKGALHGGFDCLVGVNLLREGLDLPEVALIGILDADKEGFLRSETALIQTIGRAARNVEGRVILYADAITGSMKRALDETNRRRTIQVAYNQKHHITPTTIIKKIQDITAHMESKHQKTVRAELETDRELFARNPKKLIRLKEQRMEQAVRELDFETAAILRDEILILKQK